MELTVEDVLRYEFMGSARVLSGKHSAARRPVEWISVMEMPVENFVRENEIVLTTAIGCEQDVELFRGFVQDVMDSEASALMIATGRHVFDIPKEIVELAESRGFILIELPWELRFSTIIKEVMEDLNGLQAKERAKSAEVQQELLTLILQDAKLVQIIKFIQRQIGTPLVVTDRAGTILEGSGQNRAFLDKWKRAVAQGLVPFRGEGELDSHDPLVQKFQLSELEGQPVFQLPVLQVSGDPQGYLFVLPPPNEPPKSFLTVYRVSVLEHAATAIALWLSRKNAVEATKMNLRNDFVQELVKGEFTSEDQAEAQAKLLGYNLNIPYVCVAGFPENLKDYAEKRKQQGESAARWLESMVHYIEEELYYAANSLKKEIILTYQGEQFLVFLEASREGENDSIAEFLDLTERRLGNLLPGITLSWGIGNAGKGCIGLADSCRQARTALKIGRRKKEGGQRTLYDHTRIDRVLLTLSENEEMKELIVSTIEPLAEYDRQRHMDLIGTFRTYNQYHGNVSQTARALSLHRQSLLYRLRKIESLTGLSLIDPDDLFLLELCIKTWEIGMPEHAYQH